MTPDPADRWKIRRLLIFGAVLFGAVMIVAGAIGLFGMLYTDSLIFGGVTIITGAISAYAGFATYDDTHQPHKEDADG